MKKMKTKATRRRPLLALIMLAALAAGQFTGCKSEEQLAEEATWRMDTPLPHDPMDKDVIGPWWSNGDELLNLRADGSYLLYDNNNRYGRPLQRGRWGRQSYALLTLEPYTRIEREPTRVSITKVDGMLTLIVPEMPPLQPLAGGPPATREDELIGQWQGTMGLLRLNADSTYSFLPAPGAAPASGTSLIAGHNGKWTLEGDHIALTPGTPSVSPVTITVRMAPPPVVADSSAAPPVPPAPEPVLEGLGGELIKVKAAAT